MLRTGDAELLESPYRSESLQIGRDQNGIKFGILRDEPLSSVETGMKTGDIDGVCTVDNLGQMQLAGYFPIAFITFFKWLYVQICVKHTDVPAAFLIEKANHFLRGVIIIRDDTGNVLVLLTDQLHDRHAVICYISYQSVILAGGRYDDPVDHASQLIQAFCLVDRVCLRVDEQCLIADFQGFTLKLDGQVGENVEAYRGCDEGDHVAPAELQTLCNHVGLITEFFDRSHNSCPGIRVDRRGVVERAGDGAHVAVGEFCHIFKCCHNYPFRRTSTLRSAFL